MKYRTRSIRLRKKQGKKKEAMAISMVRKGDLVCDMILLGLELYSLESILKLRNMINFDVFKVSNVN
jgi:hypothetical protein